MFFVLPMPLPRPSKFMRKTFPWPAADREGFFTRRLPITTQGVGTYLVNVAHGDKETASWLLSTNMALVTKRSPDSTLLFAANLTTGIPLAGAQVQVMRAGSLLNATTTGADGTANLTIANSGGSERTILVATHGEDEAVEATGDMNEEATGDAVFLQTDRTIYRPGHTVQYKGTARQRTNNGAAYTIPAGRPVSIDVRDPNGESVHAARLTANANGSFYSKFNLSPEAVSGTYTMTADINGTKHTQDIYVASYRKPEFSADVTASKPRYLRGEMVEMTVEGKYYFGAPLAGGK